MGEGRSHYKHDYAEGFQAYLAHSSEAELQTAYDLGRRAMIEGLTLLDLAKVHHDVLAAIVAQPEVDDPGRAERVTEVAGRFLCESLTTFEVTQRGFFEAQRTVELEQGHAAQARRIAEAALAINASLSVDDLLQLVADQVRDVLHVHWAELTVFIDDEKGQEQKERRAMSVFDELPGGRRPTPYTDDESAGALAVPLTDRSGHRFGHLQLGHKVRGSFTEEDESVLVQLAQLTSASIQNARRYEHQRFIAETLQRSLLPHHLPGTPGISLTARYLPGAQGSDVGGDWYDAFRHSDGRLALTVGDIAGRGIGAASVMGQLRMAMLAYIVEGHSPSAVVGLLDQLLHHLNDDCIATLVYLVIEPDNRMIRIINAGHLPPLLVAQDGSSQFLSGEVSVPLGVSPSTEFREATVALEQGWTLLAYTDGLVERRNTPLDKGLDRLRQVVSRTHTSLDALCDHVLGELLPHGSNDDVALLACRPVGPVGLAVGLA